MHLAHSNVLPETVTTLDYLMKNRWKVSKRNTTLSSKHCDKKDNNTKKLDNNSQYFWLLAFRMPPLLCCSGDKCADRNILYSAAMLYLAVKNRRR